MAVPKPTTVVDVRCPYCDHLAFKIYIKDGETPNAQTETRCRYCKTMVKYPNDSDFTTRKMIRET